MTYDIHDRPIEIGHIVLHKYRQIGFENDVTEHEEMIIIDTDPSGYFTPASISAEIIGETLDKIIQTNNIHSNIHMEDIHGKILEPGDVVRVYSSYIDTPLGGGYSDEKDTLILNIGQFYLDSLQHFETFEIIKKNNEMERP